MATFRMTAPAGAVLIVALTAINPATSQAQGPGAPLELVPGPRLVKPTPRAAIKNKNAAKPVTKPPAKVTTKTTARPSPRQNAAAAQPAPKAARVNARTAARTLTRERQQIGPHAPLARYAYPQPIIRAAVVPYVAMSRPVFRRGTRDAPVIARAGGSDTSHDRVMRGRDSVSLVAMLPWWRNNRMQDVSYGSPAAESKVIEAAAVWLAAHQGETEGDRRTDRADTDRADHDVMPAAVEEAIEIADSGRVNDIDLAARADPGVPTPTFMQSLLALIGGAAAAAAASARLLFS